MAETIGHPARETAVDYAIMTPSLPRYDAIEPYLRQIDANRWYSNFGPLAERLSGRLAESFGASAGSVCTMANATVALTAALQEVMSRRPGQVCLLPSWAFAACVHAVNLSGLRPVFVDIDGPSGTLTPELAAAALTPGVAAIMVVSPFGQPIEPAPWEAFRQAHGVEVVIDAAAGFDAAVASMIPTVVSLHATKPVASGEGAFVMSRDEALIERLRRRSNFGFGADRLARTSGNNAKMSEYHAAVALAALDEWPQARLRLMRAAGHWRDRLSTMTALTLQPGWGEKWISTTLNVRLAPHHDLQAVVAGLLAQGVEARSWWGPGCHRHPAFTGVARHSLGTTEDIADRTLGLPFSPNLDQQDIDRITRRLQTVISEMEA